MVAPFKPQRNLTFIDPQIFFLQKYGGISRYFHGLLDCNAYTSHFFTVLPPHLIYRFPQIIRILIYYVFAFLCLPYVFFRRPTAIHFSYYLPSPFRLIPAAFFSTIHDALQERSDLLKDKIISYFKNRHILKYNIVFVSHATKVQYTYSLRKRILSAPVIHHGISTIKPNNEACLPCTSPFILYVGRRQGYKNFNLLLDAFVKYPLLSSDYNLVIFGSEPLSFSEELILRDSSVTYFHLTGDDSILHALYRSASVLVFPSIEEGFGFPILEAFIAQCPAVCVNQSSMAEISSNLAFYFDPSSSLSLEHAIRRSTSASSKSIIAKAYSHASAFTWDLSASLHLKYYKSLTT